MTRDDQYNEDSHVKVMNTEISVLHFYPTWLPQTQTWLHTIVAEQQRCGIAAHVVCERVQNLEDFPIENLHSIEYGSRPNIWHWGLRKLRMRTDLDFIVSVGHRVNANIIHSHFGNIAWANLDAVRHLGIRHVVTFYGLDVSMLPRQVVWRKRYRDLFDQADLFLCEGPHMAECLKELGCSPAKVRVQHLGIKVKEFAYKPRRWCPGEPLRVLIAATFREKKGIPFAVEMLGRLQHIVPIEVTIIGGTTSEPRSIREERLIQRAIAAHRMEKKIRLMGFQPHSVLISEAYKHHIFLSPSVTAEDGDTEGGAPVSVIEMAATGMPIISTLHCDIPEVLGPEAARFLAPERDPEALLAIATTLLSDWEQLDVPLCALRDHVEREFDAEKQGRRLLDQYSKLIS